MKATLLTGFLPLSAGALEQLALTPQVLHKAGRKIPFLQQLQQRRDCYKHPAAALPEQTARNREVLR